MAIGFAIGFPARMVIGITMDNIALAPAFGAALGGGGEYRTRNKD